MAGILYTLTIRPIEIMFEFIFSVAQVIMKGNIVLSILSLSITVGVLTLPLYRKADKLQEDNKNKQSAMEPMIAHIKKTFKGDERFMMLQAYYRQNDYKPIHALRGSLSLFLQIPFFISAYRFLSGLQLLNGTALGPIKNLAQPDSLIVLGGIAINVLPVLMTLINIVSGTVYTKGQPIKTKIQLYGVAFVFLILLYTSPSGLVLYWTFNNIFSLIKNVFDKIIAKRFPKKNTETATDKKDDNEENTVFWLGVIFMTLFTGCFIPMSIMKSSPAEFVNIWDVSNPLRYIINSGLLAAGTFIVWFGIYYVLSDGKIRRLFREVIFIISVVAVFNYTSLGAKLGRLNANLMYDDMIVFLDTKAKIINLLLIILIIIIVHFIFRKLKSFIPGLISAGIITALVFIGIDAYSINTDYKKVVEASQLATVDNLSIPLSKTGQNVIILMMDRAMGTQFPYILNEKPELIDSFDGFTFYPNAVSFGGSTLYGTPALFGGYEYTPAKMNERDSEYLEDKQNEALSVLPVLFNDNGFDVTVCDPPFAGYQWTPDISIYDEYENINAYITEGRYNTNSKESAEQTVYLRNRNFFCNAVMRVSPLFLWRRIYDYGYYNTSVTDQAVENISEAHGYKESFLNWYCTLENLSNITTLTEDNTGTFLMMTNAATHEQTLLQQPDYVPANNVDNTLYDTDMINRYTLDGVTMRMETENQVMHYDVNVASMIKLAQWFDWMKENGVYDNTRIIIVSDHGACLDQFDLKAVDGMDVEGFIPLLLMKDFNATGFIVSDEFMTNADGVYFAIDNVIDNPVNPFTGNILDETDKYDEKIKVFICDEINPDNSRNRTTFMPGKWYTVHDNVYEPDNWSYLGEY